MGAALSLNCQSADKQDDSTLAGMTDEQRKAKEFWEVYRHATNLRIAGNLVQAKGAYLRALSINAEHEDALYYLGNVYLELAEYPQAEQCWKRLLAVNRQSARAHCQLGALYLIPEPTGYFHIDLAEQEFTKALEINKEETRPLLYLGEVALIRDDLPAAKKYLESVLQTNHRSVRAFVFIGYIAWKEGQADEALQRFTEAIRISGPLQVVAGIPGEGETKGGKQLAEPDRYAPIPIDVDELSDDLDEDALTTEMNRQYDEISTLIKALQERIRNSE